MIGAGRVLGVITARGGSKRLPRKNVLPLCGKPMIAWTIEAGRRSRRIDRLVLSSEDPEILEAARVLGCDVPFVRPEELAADSTSGIDPVLHALDQVPGFDWVVLLQPTSPLRTATHIDECIDLLEREGAPSALSVTQSPKPLHWLYAMDERQHLRPLFSKPATTARQETTQAFVPNGAIYVARSDTLRVERQFVSEATIAFLMAPEESIDVDTRQDFLLAEILLNERPSAP